MTTEQNTTSGPSFREDRHTGQFVPTVDGKDISPTSFDPDRALQIAKEAIAKGSAPKELLHVYDWLNLPPANDAERDAKEWLDKFCQPAYTKHENGVDKWLARYQVTVEWKGTRYICSGASRMGDVWLKTKDSTDFYDHRVDVEELSNWKRITLPPTNND